MPQLYPYYFYMSMISPYYDLLKRTFSYVFKNKGQFHILYVRVHLNTFVKCTVSHKIRKTQSVLQIVVYFLVFSTS